jgi:folate-binding Fe-S cluster repair protein YgfZ
VARTHFLGSAKRSLQRLRGDAPALAGDELERDGQPVGEILCAATDTFRHEAAAVLPTSTDGPLTNRRTGCVMHTVGFANGLAR